MFQPILNAHYIYLLWTTTFPSKAVVSLWLFSSVVSSWYKNRCGPISRASRFDLAKHINVLTRDRKACHTQSDGFQVYSPAIDLENESNQNIVWKKRTYSQNEPLALFSILSPPIPKSHCLILGCVFERLRALANQVLTCPIFKPVLMASCCFSITVGYGSLWWLMYQVLSFAVESFGKAEVFLTPLAQMVRGGGFRFRIRNLERGDNSFFWRISSSK